MKWTAVRWMSLYLSTRSISIRSYENPFALHAAIIVMTFLCFLEMLHQSREINSALSLGQIMGVTIFSKSILNLGIECFTIAKNNNVIAYDFLLVDHLAKVQKIEHHRYNGTPIEIGLSETMEDYVLCWNAKECGTHWSRFLSRVNASVCGNNINIPKSACDKYWASALFWETKVNRRARTNKRNNVQNEHGA